MKEAPILGYRFIFDARYTDFDTSKYIKVEE